MKRETALLASFAAVAVAAMVMALRVTAEKEVAGVHSELRNAAETAEERALHVAYLDHYSRRKFAPLFALISDALPQSKRERLGEMLSRREVTLGYARENATKANLTFQEYCDRQNAQLAKEISGELGAEIFAQVDNYIHTLPQRLMVGSINEILVYRGDGMSVTQMERLCTVIHQCDPSSPKRPPTRADWDLFVARKHAAFQEIAAASAEFLSARQREALREEMDVQLAHLKMQRRMFDAPIDLPSAVDSNQNG